MPTLPDRPDLAHLRKQAKDLLAAVRRGQADAVALVRSTMPAGAADGPARPFRLHDAQRCIARSYGFASWPELAACVAALRHASADRSVLLPELLRLLYAGDIAGGTNRSRPEAAARLLERRPDLRGDDPWLACAVGDLASVRAAIAGDPAWPNRPGGPLLLPPLVAATHSGLLRHHSYRPLILAAARVLLDAGADPNQSVPGRWPPASLAEPSAGHPLSALYGAAGQARDEELTRMLLAAGANPNDNESLYHSLESPPITRLLLEAGARIEGTNAQYRVLDFEEIEALHLLIDFGRREQPPLDWSGPLLFAIRRGRSPAHVGALLAAGADAAARTEDGTSTYRLALRYGMADVSALLHGAAGEPPPLSLEERFVAACAAGDDAEARRLQAERPDLPMSLPQAELRMLPEMAALGRGAAVRLMVERGWPLETAGGDWQASALNLAVFRGDAEMARFLLEHGADWRSQHGMGDNVCGTLSWASVNEPVAEGDWAACAEALLAHGMPRGAPAEGHGDDVVVDGRRRRFSEAVADVLLGRV